jgi:hypothetical protein
MVARHSQDRGECAAHTSERTIGDRAERLSGASSLLTREMNGLWDGSRRSAHGFQQTALNHETQE